MIQNKVELEFAIEQLKLKSDNEGLLLKQEVKNTLENLRPVNLIKKSISDLSTAPDFKGNLLNAGISLLAGYASKKAIIGSTHNPIKQIVGTLFQIVVTKMVSKNSDEIKSVAGGIIHNIFAKKKVID